MHRGTVSALPLVSRLCSNESTGCSSKAQGLRIIVRVATGMPILTLCTCCYFWTIARHTDLEEHVTHIRQNVITPWEADAVEPDVGLDIHRVVLTRFQSLKSSYQLPLPTKETKQAESAMLVPASPAPPASGILVRCSVVSSVDAVETLDFESDSEEGLVEPADRRRSAH